jgi:hypothetical protein
LAQLARHNDLIMLYLYDRLEQQLPASGQFRLSDGRASVQLNAADSRARQRHSSHFDQQLQHLRELAQRHRIHLLPCASDSDMAPHLRQGLGLKSK